MYVKIYVNLTESFDFFFSFQNEVPPPPHTHKHKYLVPTYCEELSFVLYKPQVLALPCIEMHVSQQEPKCKEWSEFTPYVGF